MIGDKKASNALSIDFAEKSMKLATCLSRGCALIHLRG